MMARPTVVLNRGFSTDRQIRPSGYPRWVPAAPWLSVIIPTYNGSSFLGHALDSIAIQHADDIEVIAVDDGSTDDTVAILEGYAAKLPLTVIQQGRIGNWVAGTNRGLQAASGRYASILHQDDLWLPGRLDAVRGELAGRSHDVLLVHPVWFLNQRGRFVGRWTCPLPTGEPIPSEAVMERLLVQNFVSIPGAAFPREVALAAGGMDEALWYTADWDLWLRLAGRIPTLYIQPTLGAVRLHGSSITTTETARLGEFREQHETVLRRHLETWSVNGRRRDRVRAAAEFSVDVNVTLAAMANRQPKSVSSLLGRWVRLGPAGWGRYLRNSRIHQRVGARLRAGLGWRKLQGYPPK
jgi:GT2 family glycosyltransferase